MYSLSPIIEIRGYELHPVGCETQRGKRTETESLYACVGPRLRLLEQCMEPRTLVSERDGLFCCGTAIVLVNRGLRLYAFVD